MKQRVIHATCYGYGRTFCGLSTLKTTNVVTVPSGRFMRESDGVTCKRCWNSAA